MGTVEWGWGEGIVLVSSTAGGLRPVHGMLRPVHGMLRPVHGMLRPVHDILRLVSSLLHFGSSLLRSIAGMLTLKCLLGLVSRLSL